MYHKAIRQICERYGKKYSRLFQNQLCGGTDEVICKSVVETLKLPISADEFEAQLTDLTRKTLPSAPLKKGAERLLTHLYDYKVPMALATNSTEQAVRLHAATRPKFFGMFHHKVSVTDSEVDRGKPHPDLYLVALSRFKEKPKPKDVVMIPEKRTVRERTRQATLVLPSLMDFKPELFGLPAYDEPYDTRSRKSRL